MDGNPRKRPVTIMLVLVTIGALFYLYSQNSGSSSIESGSKSLKHFSWRADEDNGESFSATSAVPKTIPVRYLNLNLTQKKKITFTLPLVSSDMKQSSYFTFLFTFLRSVMIVYQSSFHA